MRIIELSQHPEYLDKAIKYFWSCWGNDSNFAFYEDCIKHSLDAKNALPKFYVALSDEQIVGSYALLVNDLISRQDLMPWFACLFVNESHRKQGLAGRLLDHGLAEARSRGFVELYLSTDLVNFYERKGWQRTSTGVSVSGELFNIYGKKTAIPT